MSDTTRKRQGPTTPGAHNAHQPAQADTPKGRPQGATPNGNGAGDLDGIDLDELDEPPTLAPVLTNGQNDALRAAAARAKRERLADIVPELEDDHRILITRLGDGDYDNFPAETRAKLLALVDDPRKTEDDRAREANRILGIPDPDDDISTRLLRLSDGDLDEAPTGELILTREDGHGLLPAGSVTSIAGDPGIGKTWVALLAVKAALDADESALLIDYEDTPARIGARLEALGVTGAALEHVWFYKNPADFKPEEVERLIAFVSTESIGIVVIDSVTEALMAEELDENVGGDYAAWFELLPQPLARAGPRVVLLDHRAKPSNKLASAPRGLWPIASRHKLAAVDVAYVLEDVTPFARTNPGATGKLDLVIAKDRHGVIGAARDTAARIELTPTVTGTLDVRILVPDAKPARDDVDTGSGGAFGRIVGHRKEVLEALDYVWRKECQEANDRNDSEPLGVPTSRIEGRLRELALATGTPFHFTNGELAGPLHSFADQGRIEHHKYRNANLWRPRLDRAPALPLDDEEATE